MVNKNWLFALFIAVIFFVVMAGIKFFNIAYPISVVSTTKSTEMSVVGEGKIDAVPDTANVNLGIRVDNTITVQQAQSKINEVNNKIIEAMKNLGINKEDIKTSNYSIYPRYIYENNQDRVSGYSGNVTVSVKVRNISLVPQVIEEGTKAGANEVQGAQFSIDKPEKYREQARKQAIANAKEQAQKLASSLGIKLGKVVNIVESTSGNVVPLYNAAAKSLDGYGGGSPSIEPGSQTITSTVTLYFEKK